MINFFSSNDVCIDALVTAESALPFRFLCLSSLSCLEADLIPAYIVPLRINAPYPKHFHYVIEMTTMPIA
jgi:hypothetical protein